MSHIQLAQYRVALNDIMKYASLGTDGIRVWEKHYSPSFDVHFKTTEERDEVLNKLDAHFIKNTSSTTLERPTPPKYRMMKNGKVTYVEHDKPLIHNLSKI